MAVIGCGSTEEEIVALSNLIKSTEQGMVKGVDEDTMYAFRGIRYAKAPIGERRFFPPVALDDEDKWSGIRDAEEFGNVCVQNDGTGSEDCLTLNIFTPKGSGPYPVMVWIHGGALIQGSSSVPGYDIPALVNQGVVVVTINYRLNAFGFLPHPVLEDPTGNFGLKDQVMALRWVQDNIANFYGDPGNVTIFGESAGGHSVLSLMASLVRDEGLFHKAIVQSGSYSPTQTPLSLGYYTLGAAFGDLNSYPDVVPGFPPTGVGPCSGTNTEILACLRGLSVAEVMAAQAAGPAWAWISPVYAASTFLPKNIATALTDGDVADVPVMIGSNLNEGSLFTAMFMPQYGNFEAPANLLTGVTTLLATDFRSYSRNAVSTYYTAQAVTKYGDNINKYRNAHSMIFTDATFTCNALGHATLLAQRAGQNTYAYWFTDNDAPINPTYGALAALSAFFNLGNWGLGASHSFEIQYIFGTVQDHDNVTGDQVDLSNRMIAYWTNFAKNGAPGGGWTVYNGTNIRNLNPADDSDSTAVAFATAHYCGCWATPAACWPVSP